MKEHIAPPIKKQRVKKLIEEGKKAYQRFLAANEGDCRKVLVEEKDFATGKYVGYTDNYIRTYIDDNGENLIGQMVKVILKKSYCDGISAVVK